MKTFLLLLFLTVFAFGCSSGEKASAEEGDQAEVEEAESGEESSEEGDEKEEKNDGKKADEKKESKDEKPKGEERKAKADICKNVKWSHAKGSKGPENWQKLCEAYKPCKGKAQSPINIEENFVMKADKGLSALKVKFGKAKADIVNNGHTVQFNIEGNHSTTIGKKKYKLLQFHYHAKSEHTIDGKHFPLEVHFVHKYSDTDYAVIGVMFKPGKPDPLLSRFLMKFPEMKGSFKSEATFELAKLLPSTKDYYHYKGSLTTPPCSEVVNWYLMKEPVEASPVQLATFGALLNDNNRPVMELNGREVYSYGG